MNNDAIGYRLTGQIEYQHHVIDIDRVVVTGFADHRPRWDKHLAVDIVADLTKNVFIGFDEGFTVSDFVPWSFNPYYPEHFYYYKRDIEWSDLMWPSRNEYKPTLDDDLKAARSVTEKLVNDWNNGVVPTNYRLPERLTSIKVESKPFGDTTTCLLTTSSQRLLPS